MSQQNKKPTPSQSTDEMTIQQDEKHKDCESGAPIEHYHGEKTSKRVGGEGDLDEETLDEDAPYNKTYGLEKPKSSKGKN